MTLACSRVGHLQDEQSTSRTQQPRNPQGNAALPAASQRVTNQRVARRHPQRYRAAVQRCVALAFDLALTRSAPECGDAGGRQCTTTCGCLHELQGCQGFLRWPAVACTGWQVEAWGKQADNSRGGAAVTHSLTHCLNPHLTSLSASPHLTHPLTRSLWPSTHKTNAMLLCCRRRPSLRPR